MYIDKSTLKTEFGLPDSWIQRLDPPDLWRPNGSNQAGPPVPLYLRARVEQFLAAHQAEYTQLQTERHQLAQASDAMKRREADAATVHAKDQAARAWARAQPITIADFTPTELEKKAMRGEADVLFHLLVPAENVYTELFFRYTNYTQLKAAISEQFIKDHKRRNLAFRLILDRLEAMLRAKVAQGGKGNE